MRGWICAVVAAPLGVAVVNGCTGDDEVFGAQDAGTFEGGTQTDGGTNPDTGAPRLACGDAGGTPQRLLLSGAQPTSGELVAINLGTSAVDGRYSFPAEFGGTVFLAGNEPYLLTGKDEVIRLDAREPWKAVATWNVTGDDKPEGGLDLANPSAIVAPGCDKGYVLRYNRNKIAVLDVGDPAGGAPTGYIDLSSLVQPDDRDGIVEMTHALYVPSRKRIYVVLGAIDTGRVVDPTGIPKLICPQTVSSIIAIDPETDSVVSLGGSAPGGGIALLGANPLRGTSSFHYDAARDRLIVLHAGCNEDDGAGGAGPLVKRQIDEVNLATGQVTMALDLSSFGFPSSLAYENGQNAAVAFYFDGYLWNPSETTLGPEIVGGAEVVTNDGHGTIFATRTNFLADGGTVLDVVKLPFTQPDAAAPVLSEPFTVPGTFPNNMEVWPR